MAISKEHFSRSQTFYSFLKTCSKELSKIIELSSWTLVSANLSAIFFSLRARNCFVFCLFVFLQKVFLFFWQQNKNFYWHWWQEDTRKFDLKQNISIDSEKPSLKAINYWVLHEKNKKKSSMKPEVKAKLWALLSTITASMKWKFYFTKDCIYFTENVPVRRHFICSQKKKKRL